MSCFASTANGGFTAEVSIAFFQCRLDVVRSFEGGRRQSTMLIDRLVHRCEVVPIEGESYRLKEAKERAEQKAKLRGAPARKAKKS